MAQKQGSSKKIGRAKRRPGNEKRKRTRPDLLRKLRNLRRHGASEKQIKEWVTEKAKKEGTAGAVVLYKHRDTVLKEMKKAG